VKNVDFGLAKATLHEGQTRGGIKGKMSYLAPEQLYDQPVDGRTDVFQLGICLHELLTGQRLFKGDSDQQRAVAVLERPIPPPREIVPSLPKELDEVVMWSLQRDPARRPATADEFRRALEGAAVGIGSVSGHDRAAG
jgi:serine/threonine-protein kinase